MSFIVIFHTIVFCILSFIAGFVVAVCMEPCSSNVRSDWKND